MFEQTLSVSEVFGNCRKYEFTVYSRMDSHVFGTNVWGVTGVDRTVRIVFGKSSAV